MEFEVLGSVRIRGPVVARELTGRMQRTLLGVLLARANRAVPMETLTVAVYSGAAPRSGQRLQLHVHKLRRMLDRPDRLVLTPEGYRLQVLPGELDAERFEALISQAEDIAGEDAERCAELLGKALALWRGVPYGGLDVSPLAEDADRLSERRLAALELYYETELRRGRHTALVGELTELARQYPLRERLTGLLMIALYRGGRQADALRTYRAARQTLVDELGLEPGPELRLIEQRVIAGEAIELGTVATQAAAPAQLPHDVRCFVGRDHELSQLDGLLTGAGDVPVLISALAGGAGVGKTALAVRWAHRVRARFPDGQLYVDLHGYGPHRPVSPEDALAGFLRALGVEPAAIPRELSERAALFRTLLDGRRMLLVLDNARTVAQLRPLLPGSRSCFVLVTSRDSLTGLVVREGAHRINLDRLPADEASRLFQALAGERSGAEPEAIRALVERCARLPLALRIAAELTRTRCGSSVSDLVAELADERGWLDLFDVDGDRQTAVRAVFSWSYRHLPPAAARVFRLWGLHPGHDADAFSLAALAGADLRDTRRMVDVLVGAHLAEEDPAGRYRMHDLMRAYARECVADDEPAPHREAALRRLLDWYLHTTVAARSVLDPHARTIVLGDRPEHVPTFTTRTEVLDWFERERAGLVAVVGMAAELGADTIAWQLSSALLSFFYVSKHWQDWITTHRTGVAAARRAGDPAGQAHVLNGLGVAYSDLRRFDEAIACHREAAELYGQTDSRWGEAWNLNNLGVVYDELSRFVEALDCYRRAMELFREVGDPRGEALTMVNLGDVHRQLCQFDLAISWVRRAMEIQDAVGDRHSQRFTLRCLGDLHRDSGQHEEAIDRYRHALAISRELGDQRRVAKLLDRLATVLAAAGAGPAADACAEEAAVIRADGGTS